MHTKLHTCMRRLQCASVRVHTIEQGMDHGPINPFKYISLLCLNRHDIHLYNTTTSTMYH